MSHGGIVVLQALMKVLSTLFPTLRVWPQFMTSHVINSLYTQLAMFGFDSRHGYYKYVWSAAHQSCGHKDVRMWWLQAARTR